VAGIGESVVEMLGLAAIPAESIAPVARPRNDCLYFVHGFPADQSTLREPAVQMFDLSLTSTGYLTLPAPVERSDRIAVALRYESTGIDATEIRDMPYPKGMSGGGVWEVESLTGSTQLWAPSRCRFIGIIRSFDPKARELYATRVEHWLELVATELPELRGVVDKLSASTQAGDQIPRERSGLLADE